MIFVNIAYTLILLGVGFGFGYFFARWKIVIRRVETDGYIEGKIERTDGPPGKGIRLGTGYYPKGAKKLELNRVERFKVRVDGPKPPDKSLDYGTEIKSVGAIERPAFFRKVMD